MNPEQSIDARLALALKGAEMSEPEALLARAQYHGIAPLLYARSGAPVFRGSALASAMWDLRHRQVLTRLLGAFAERGIRNLVMKGTALAYDLYADPALRPRGDSDLLIAPEDLTAARQTLRDQEFAVVFEEEAPAQAGASQELWRWHAGDGTSHDVDLHWQAFNGPALVDLIPTREAFDEAVALPRLATGAQALSHDHSLLHTCVHRAQHIHSPYFVAGTAHYGGDRLIWLHDVDLLARSLTQQEWSRFAIRARKRGIAPVCLGALDEAARLLGTEVPPEVRAELSARGGPATDYLIHAGPVGRAVANVKASGLRRGLAYAWSRVLPGPAFVRSQYPESRQPLALLYLRRIGRFVAGGRP